VSNFFYIKIKPQQKCKTDGKDNQQLIDEDHHTAGKYCEPIKEFANQFFLLLLPILRVSR
jgi:hypothetical protein